MPRLRASLHRDNNAALNIAEGEIGSCQPRNTVEGVRVDCFPDLYAALAGNPPDQVITL